MFGSFSLPILVWRHGWIGARNRKLYGCGDGLIWQFIWVGSFLLFNILHGMFSGRPGYSITTVEVVRPPAHHRAPPCARCAARTSRPPSGR
jgi:hypothetical protein